MSLSHRTQVQLHKNLFLIQQWLDGFYRPDNGGIREAILGRTAEYVVIKNLPLPDGYHPDYLDALLIVDDFPRPPVGVYLLNKGNERFVAQIAGKFNAFRDSAAHSAPTIQGMTWVCYHYGGNAWRYDANQPEKSDNLAKFLASFYAELNS